MIGLVTFEVPPDWVPVLQLYGLGTSLTAFQNVEGFLGVFTEIGKSDYASYNKNFYNATFYSALRDFPQILYPNLDDTHSHALYLQDLCGPFCTLLVVGAADDQRNANQVSPYVNKYFHELHYASCNDSFTSPYFKNLVSKSHRRFDMCKKSFCWN